MPAIPRLLICEGPEDAHFFRRLIEERNLPRFVIEAAGGKDQFYNAISKFNLEKTKQFRSLGHLLIVADNDDVPLERFANVCRQVERFFGAGRAPQRPLEATRRTATEPSISVLMLPWENTHGHLERLCVPATRDADSRIAEQVDQFMALVRSEAWGSESRQGKAWLRSNLAVRCDYDPFIPLGTAFSENRNRHLIPLNHRSFDGICEFLSGFPD